MSLPQSKDGTNTTQKINNFAGSIFAVKRFINIKWSTDLPMDCLSSRNLLLIFNSIMNFIWRDPPAPHLLSDICDTYSPCATTRESSQNCNYHIHGVRTAPRERTRTDSQEIIYFVHICKFSITFRCLFLFIFASPALRSFRFAVD